MTRKSASAYWRNLPDLTLPMARVASALDEIYALGDPPVYEPSPDQSIAAIAQAQGKPPFLKVAYDSAA